MDLLSLHNSPEAISDATRAIRDGILHRSSDIRDPNFDSIHRDDLAALFASYDDTFFGRWLGETVRAKTGTPLTFRLSSTMTRAGGKTIHTRIPLRAGGYQWHFEIAIASQLLFMTFREVERAVTVCGLPCEDRLQALQRIMEHEILHLAELLAWNKSSCSQRRFKSLAKNIFGHADTKHDLVTPRERAQVTHDIHLGQHVEFEFAGVRRVGVVNRVHRRATVLVESRKGIPYSNGKKYEKFYIPLPMLKAVQ
jgi:hypothetical protein